MKNYSKSKDKPNQPGPGFRTASSFRGSIFSGGGSKFSGNKPQNIKVKFNPAQFKTQHKG
jgi:hypothetical protein